MKRQIVLKSLILKNFKGVKELAVNFGQVTNVYGDNGTGKTTIFDAFTWLLFDKDSRDRKSFEIKTLNGNNEVLHGLEHMVKAVVLVDGREIILCKIHKEKWTKRKGEAQRTLTGNETLYFIDDIPLKQSEYQNKVSDFIKEDIFKLLTNPLNFSVNMKWQQRRNLVLELIGDISTESILNSKSNLKALEKLLDNKDLDTLRKSIAARKKKLNEAIKAIPYRIDELNNYILDIDFNAVNLELKGYEAQLKDIEDRLDTKSTLREEALEEKRRLCQLKDLLMELELKAKSEAQAPVKALYESLNGSEREISRLENQLVLGESKLNSKENELLQLELQLKDLKEKWDKTNDEQLIIPEDSFICPTCRRSFEVQDIEGKRMYLFEKFTRHKAKTLAELNASRTALKEKLQLLEEEVAKARHNNELLNKTLEEKKIEREGIKKNIDSFKVEITLESNEEYQKNAGEIAALEDRLSKAAEVDNDLFKLKEEKKELCQKVEQFKATLSAKEQNERFNSRISELLREEKLLAQQIAELEGQELLCEEFIKTKVEMLESGINSKFKLVKFKLFNTLVNGTVEECCEALIDGVPFSNTNTASQINAGLDIINALSEHYEVSAPIFIDNRESINRLLPCRSQLINLIVSRDQDLIIKGEEPYGL